MTSLNLRKHNIDLVFLLVLFVIFTFSAVSVLLMGINSYKGVTAISEQTATSRAATMYIREIFHQNDRGGNISLGSFDGERSFVIDQGEGYVLYIYMHDGYLMELYTTGDAAVTADGGQIIMPLNEFEIYQASEHIFYITCVDENNTTEAMTVSVKSKKGGSNE